MSRDFINKLNDDCLSHICMHLPIHERLGIRRVCRRWKYIIEQCVPSIKKLRLSNDRELWTLELSTSVNSILFQSYTIVQENLLKFLTLYGQSLQQLDLHFVSRLHKKDCPTAKFIAKCCSNLTKLSFNDAVPFSSNDMTIIFVACKKLEQIDLSIKSAKDLTCLQALPKNPMKIITIRSCNTKTSFHCEPEDLSAFPNLLKLKLVRFQIDVESMNVIATNQNVIKIEFEQCTFVNDSILAIGNCNNLNRLLITTEAGDQISDNFLRELVTNCQKLQYLNISCIKWNFQVILRTGMGAIAQLPYLNTLVMENIKVAELNYMKMMPTLKLIHYANSTSGNGIDDDFIISLLLHAPNLEYLNINYRTGASVKVLDAANQITCTRANNVELKIFVDSKLAQACKQRLFDSPLLKIIGDYKDIDKLERLCLNCKLWNLDYDNLNRAFQVFFNA